MPLNYFKGSVQFESNVDMDENVYANKNITIRDQVLGMNELVPTYSWSNDPDTGMFHPSNADDTISFMNNGRESMRINENGWLGIDKTPNYTLDVNGDVFVSGYNNLLPPGSIITSSSSNVPPTYLLPNGREVSRTVYHDLFNAIGTKYGDGDGVNTFNIPNILPQSYASTSGKYLYSGSKDGELHQIDPQTMTLSQKYVHGNSITKIVKHGSALYFSSTDATVQKIDSSDMSFISEFTGHSATVSALALDSDGYLYTGSYDNTIKKINTSDMSVVLDVQVASAVRAMSFGIDTLFVAYGKKVMELDKDTFNEIKKADVANDIITDMRFHDGSLYVTARDNTVIRTSTNKTGFYKDAIFNPNPNSSVNTMLSISTGLQYVFSTNDNGELFKLDKNSLGLSDVFDEITTACTSVTWGIDVFIGFDNGEIRKIEPLSMLEKKSDPYQEHSDAVNTLYLEVTDSLLYKYLKY